MLDRIKKALVEPHKLIQFRKDRLRRVFLYLTFFALLFSTSTVIGTLTFEGLETSVQAVFRDDVNTQALPCALEDGQLVCESPQSQLLYEGNNIVMRLDVDQDTDLSTLRGLRYYGLLQNEGLSLVFMGNELRFFTYETLALERLDFTTFDDQTLDDLFVLVDRVILELRPLWAPVVMIGRLIGALVLFNVFIVINAFILRFRLPMVPFKQMYVMFAYASTTLFIVLIFDTLVTLNIFLFIVLLFFAFRQTSKMALELQKRLLFKDDDAA